MRRFADLAPVDALQAAIAIERRNTELYQNLAKIFESYDRKLGEIFTAMAEEEFSHRAQLEAYLQEHFPGTHATTEADPGLQEPVEAPDLEEPEVFIFDNLNVQDAIEMARRAESRAFDFYQNMAQETRDEGLRALCRHMAEVEAGHRDTFTHWKKEG